MDREKEGRERSPLGGLSVNGRGGSERGAREASEVRLGKVREPQIRVASAARSIIIFLSTDPFVIETRGR